VPVFILALFITFLSKRLVLFLRDQTCTEKVCLFETYLQIQTLIASKRRHRKNKKLQSYRYKDI
jgi:hypothetical protein